MLNDAERLQMKVLDALACAGAPLADTPAVDGMSRDEVLAVLDQLLVLRLVDATALYGDDRLQSVRDLRVTVGGEHWLRQAARRARPAADAGLRAGVPLDEKRRRRAEFMQTLYDEVDGAVMSLVSPESIGARIGLSPGETDAVVEYLVNEGLVEPLGGEVSLRHAGVQEVEQARSAPEQPTEHFPPYVFVHVEGDAYGVQAGTVGSNQIVTVELAAQRPAIETFIVEMRRQLDGLPISPEERETVRADLDTVEAQLRSPKPRPAVLRETLSSLRAVAEGVAGSSVFAGLLELAQHVRL